MSALLPGCSKADAPVSARLIESIETRIIRMASYFGSRSGVDEDDLCQEAWLAVLETLPRLDMSVGVPEQHLLKRARWRMLDVIRHNSRRQHISLTELGEDVLVFDPPSETFDLEHLLKRLTIIQQRILKALLEGYTWREAGDIVGCTSANVAYHVRRIRKVYRKVQEEMNF